MRRYRSWSRRFGRLGLYAHSHSMVWPRVSFGIEGGYEYVAFTFGTFGGDPVVGAELDLRGTPAGRLISTTYWTVHGWREARREKKEQPDG